MEELCVSFISRNRFYSSLLSKINKVSFPQVKTAGIGFTKQGKIVLYYNEEFFENMSLSECQAVLEHEILHIFFKHPFRLPKEEGQQELNDVKNIACDMAINQYLPDLPKEIKDSKGEVIFKGGVYPETYGFPKEMFAEWYFAELKKLPKKEKGGGKGEGKGQLVDDHDMWGKTVNEKGEVEEVAGNVDCDIEHELDKIVRQAAKECEGDKSIGKLPEGIRRELEAIRNPKKKNPWKKRLKIFVNTVLTLSKKRSQKKINRRFIEEVDYAVPGKKKDRRPKLLLARDTSGSVCNDTIQQQFLGEMINISKFCDVIVADCDTEVHQTYHVKKVTDFKSYMGGGGTSFEPVFEVARKLAVDGIIYLTDTYGSFPKKEDIGKFSAKTIWVTIGQEKVSIPFGKHVNISDNL